ncbi:DUF2092 domain-containing protein [Planctomycetales bacterium ZRK34]|nr:DUF2092 domain-containing protein [Planctomycetales bacterium ZRK34]
MTPVRAADDSPQIDPQADKVLHAMSDYYKAMDSMALLGGAKLVRSIPNQTQNLNTQFKFAMKRPNHFMMKPIGADADRWSTIVNDGEHLTIYVGPINKYTVSDAPKTLDDTINHQLVGMLSSMIGRVVGSLMTSDPYTALTKPAEQADYLGKQPVDGVDCHHLRLGDGQSSWEFWIAAGDEPQLLQVRPDMSAIAKRAHDAGQNIKLEMTLYTKDLEPNAKLADDAFAFAPPAGAEKVDSFFQENRPPQHGLVGAAAPDFTLATLDGAQRTLSDHKGKDIVVLDFWATWCGPCVRAMPIIESVVTDYKGKNVVLYAVNLREDKPKIEKFLKARKLDVNVLMDTDGSIADKYQVKGIPQTVIIDRDGTVQVVHVGLLPDLKAQLAGELDDLVAGKKLAQ